MIIWLFVRGGGAENCSAATKTDKGRKNAALSNFRWLMGNWLKLPEP